MCEYNNLTVEELKNLPKEIKINYINISNNEKLGHLQNINDIKELKKQVKKILKIKEEKENLLKSINKEDLTINKKINKI